jgi:hypothetical protein
MKNTFKLLGIIALLAVIGFSMAACDSEVKGPSLNGTYIQEGDDYSLSYSFRGSDFIMERKIYQPFVDVGTFTYTDATITFKLLPSNDKWTQSYILNDAYLELAPNDGGNWAGRFSKKAEPSKPEYKVLGSKPYTEESFSEVWSEVWNNHMGGVGTQLGKLVEDGISIMGGTNYLALWDLIRTEWGKKPSTAKGVVAVVKLDVYRVFGQFSIDPANGIMYWDGYFYND